MRERLEQVEEVNRSLRLSLLEQMKRRKKEEEVFANVLAQEKNKTTRRLARLLSKLRKR